MAIVTRSNLKIAFKIAKKLLKSCAASIREFKQSIGRSKCPWVKYVSKSGKVCCSFVKKSILKLIEREQEEFEILKCNRSTRSYFVKNLNKSSAYYVDILSAGAGRCTCKSNKYRDGDCKHIEVVRDYLEQNKPEPPKIKEKTQGYVFNIKGVEAKIEEIFTLGGVSYLIRWGGKVIGDIYQYGAEYLVVDAEGEEWRTIASKKSFRSAIEFCLPF